MKRLLLTVSATLLLHAAYAQCAMQDLRDKHLFHLSFNSPAQVKRATLILSDSRREVMLKKYVKVKKGYNTAQLYVRDIDRNPYHLSIALTGTGEAVVEVLLTNNSKQ